MSNVTVTPAAAKFMNRMVRFSGKPSGAGFRLMVSLGGCSGFNSEFTVEDGPVAGDSVLEMGELKLFLNAESRLLLEGVTIDFADSPLKSGLIFINPNQAPCSCSSTTHAHPAAPNVATVALDSIRRH